MVRPHEMRREKIQKTSKLFDGLLSQAYVSGLVSQTNSRFHVCEELGIRAELLAFFPKECNRSTVTRSQATEKIKKTTTPNPQPLSETRRCLLTTASHLTGQCFKKVIRI
uniref:Uncharacterized protein n=1 Tax=Sphaerodactylus townsendi TaxID=933632 RepID=A0ACB8G6D7_9SAUR